MDGTFFTWRPAMDHDLGYHKAEYEQPPIDVLWLLMAASV